MNVMNYAEQILNNLVTLPEDKIIEVADFVQFLKTKTEKEKKQLQEPLLTKKEALILRRRLSTFEKDWSLPEMDIYDKL